MRASGGETVVVVCLALLACKMDDSEKAAQGEPVVAAAGDSTGIVECDQYIAKIAKCGTMPPASIEQLRTSYKSAAANPLSKSQMAASCSQAAGLINCPNAAAAPTAAPAAAPAQAASNVHGAIATSSSSTHFGVALNYPSDAAANAAAVAKCGRSDCKLAETFKPSQCVVVSTIEPAPGKGGVAWGNEATMEVAIKELTRVCDEHKFKCPVVGSGCSDGGAPETLGGGAEIASAPPIKQFKPKPASKGKACNVMTNDCPAGQKCVSDGTTRSGGFCKRVAASKGKACNVMANDCPAGQKCVSDGRTRSGGFCR